MIIFISCNTPQVSQVFRKIKQPCSREVTTKLNDKWWKCTLDVPNMLRHITNCTWILRVYWAPFNNIKHSTINLWHWNDDDNVINLTNQITVEYINYLILCSHILVCLWTVSVTFELCIYGFNTLKIFYIYVQSTKKSIKCYSGKVFYHWRVTSPLSWQS